MEKYLKVDGGIGRCIASTGAVEEFAKNNKDVNVISSFPYIFESLEYVKRVYPIGTPFLYEDRVINGEYLEPEPYNHHMYYKEMKHISATFNYLLSGKSDYVEPILRLHDSEIEKGKETMDRVRQKDKKILMIQPYASSGGTKVSDESYRSIKTSFVQSLFEKLKDRYVFVVVKTPHQLEVPGTISFGDSNMRYIIGSIPHVDALLCCDSFLHHASAAIGTPTKTVVLWGGTSQDNLGYKDHVNLRAKEVREFEPNRIVHNHAHYLSRNKGANDFSKIEDQVIKAIEG